jgi:superfamily I DNA/RNA helicase
LVDEYQDTSHAQVMLVDLLAGPGGNLCVVGDDDQCLIEGSEITMADGSRKAIEHVVPGEFVLSAHGAGVIGPSPRTCAHGAGPPRPTRRSLASSDGEQLAEERRLFYVAATRAKDRLVITHVAERSGRPTGGPSGFLVEARLYRADARRAA